MSEEDFETRFLGEAPDALAPDGSEVRFGPVLVPTSRHPGASVAHFRLESGRVTRAVVHRTVAETWYILAGEGEMWRRQGAREEVTPLAPGTFLTLPVGTAFQFRATGSSPLEAVALTLPAWPGEDEAASVDGPWAPTP